MDLFKYYIEEGLQIELFLLSSIALFVFLTLVFLIALFLSRFMTNRRLKLEERFEPIVEELLFDVMFNDTPINELLNHRMYTRYHKKNIFMKMLIRSCFSMHQQFSGDIAERLEKFYQTSALKKYSMQKLNSNAWYKKCQGIRELSEMNQDDVVPDIISLCFSKHQLVKQAAFVGIIKLKGIEGLKNLQKFTEFIDDWTLSHILMAIEETDSTNFTDLNFLLRHKNPSMVLLGLRLIRYFSLPGYQKAISNVQAPLLSDRIQLEIQKHLQLLETRIKE